MSLNFKHYEDLPLRNPPLREVICQVSFAPLLEIVQKLPTGFQSKIRDRFPKFAMSQAVGIDINQPLPSEYVFKSANDGSSVSLTFNFLALSTKEYSHWDAFKKEMQGLLQAFSEAHGDILVTRIGLRYINQLTKENLGLEQPEDLVSILNDNLNCLITNKSWTTPKSAFFQISLEDGENDLTIRLNIDRKPENKDLRIILDFDYFKTYSTPIIITIDDIVAKLHEFHTHCYDAFRWSINEEKIQILKPAEKLGG
jgi:uncharacterized protein (TIGR04255 family)